MTRAQRSQLRELTIQLTELRGTLEKIRWEIGEGLSTHEDISTARAVADIKAAISHMQGVI